MKNITSYQGRLPKFHLHRLTPADCHEFDQIVDFIMRSRKQLFPMLDHQQLPDDLAHFQQTFIDDDLGCLIKLENGSQLIGVVGFKRYDHRFSNFNLSSTPVVEIVKLFIHEDFRQLGLASVLIDHLKTIATQRKIKTLYLHTHPFLNGAEIFWLKQGFHKILQEDDGIWNTIHMTADLI
ncbi:hypothetical protein CAP51_07920 [Acinetobacter populi]|uniref:N-acetyltransferase domain-containing protein n=2 Tax=Acinetobacter populi TaxID=1582270 RepID=A0A1Z9YZM7_9GAMM|nr:hypothetical protein CAP51_07920 [Acinetobacter populi]